VKYLHDDEHIVDLVISPVGALFTDPHDSAGVYSLIVKKRRGHWLLDNLGELYRKADP